MWDAAIDYAIIIAIAIIFIFIGGSSIYMHGKQLQHEKNPIYFSFGIAMAGAGGSILSSLVMGLLVPREIRNIIRTTKRDVQF